MKSERTVKDHKFYIGISIFLHRKRFTGYIRPLELQILSLNSESVLKNYTAQQNATIDNLKIGIAISKTINTHLN